MPPDVVFYCETGGKSAPWYRTLGGIRSAFKTTWHGRAGWRYKGGKPPRVYRGTISWQEVDPETGQSLPMDPITRLAP